MTGFGLSADGRLVLAQTGGIDPSVPHAIVRIPFAGGPRTVLVRNATQPSWNR